MVSSNYLVIFFICLPDRLLPLLTKCDTLLLIQRRKLVRFHTRIITGLIYSFIALHLISGL